MNFKYSEHGIKNKEIYERIYSDFIEWCKTKASGGTFSTYMDGEPVFMFAGIEISYSSFLRNNK